MFKMLFDFYKDYADNWKEKIVIIYYFLMIAFLFISGVYFLFNDYNIGIKIFGFGIVFVFTFVEGWIWGSDF